MLQDRILKLKEDILHCQMQYATANQYEQAEIRTQITRDNEEIETITNKLRLE